MSWYYAENNERRGPINDAAFDSLVAAGTVRPETLVWKDGMANWQSLSASGYRKPGAALPAGMPPVPSDAGEESARQPGVEMGVCSESGRILPRDELVEIDGRLVSVEYKNVVLQRIREGVGSSGSSIDPEALAQQIMARDYRLYPGSCLGRGWQLLKKHFWLLVLSSFLMTLVMYASVFTLIGIFFTLGPLTAGLYWLTLRLQRNEPGSVSDIFAGFSRNFWQLVSVGLLPMVLMFACFLPMGICFGVAVAVSPKNPSVPLMIVAGFLAIASSIVLIYLSVSWVFSFLLVIDKQIEAWPAMNLSRRVVSMHWWQVFGVLFLTGLVVFGVMFFLSVLGGFLTGLGNSRSPALAIIGTCISLAGSLSSLALGPFLYTTIVTMYEDIFGHQASRQ